MCVRRERGLGDGVGEKLEWGEGVEVREVDVCGLIINCCSSWLFRNLAVQSL